MNTHWQILVVADDQVACESLAAGLRHDGYAVDTAAFGREALERAARGHYALCVVSLKMPGGMDGDETLIELCRAHADAPVIIVTPHATVDAAIADLKGGAPEYMVRPSPPEEISLLVNRIVRVKNLQRENAILRKQLSRQYCFQDIVGKNGRMRQILSLARDVASLPSPVLIQGESGTGKELIARAIHNSGERSQKPFLSVSCAALSGTLLESELFGRERGGFAFAGAGKSGKFEMAGGGTIFLDEIGEISPKLQMSLLRVLQDGSICRVGGQEEWRVDARVIAASRADLQQAVAHGRFRDDLFQRLNGIAIRVPPLRSRREDIPLLANHFLEWLSHELGKEMAAISEGGLKALMDYHWPGNVRELENAIERAVVTCRGGVLTEDDFTFLPFDSQALPLTVPPGMTLQEMEKVAIAATLQRTSGNIKESAAILGIDRSTIYEKIKKYEIPR